ncbi:MAG: hypothetical protein M1376_19160 [Planctomycetes bacterium]|nr:hypothetical protein [Planctomycetota bacterium]
MNKRNYLCVAVSVLTPGLLGTLVVGGCGAGKPAPVVRLPDAPQMVGGGIMIEWKAPERGTVYLVEKQTGKIIETRSLEEGEVYSFTATSVVQADEFEQMLGIRFSRARFLLYFEPAAAEDSAPQATATVRAWSRFD